MRAAFSESSLPSDSLSIAGRCGTAAGLVLMLTLLYAPWALGCRTPWAVDGLVVLALCSGTLLAADCLIAWRLPRVRRWCAWCAGLLLVQGWWMVLNAHGDYQSLTQGNSASGVIIHAESWWPSAPGAVDFASCRQMLAQITAVLVALIVACDRAAERPWRWALITTIALGCVSIAGYGLLQKAGVVPSIAERQYAESVFASFDYHGTAGAFLNLGIPAVFAVSMNRKRWTGWAALLICMAAALTNVSRAAAALALIILAAMAVWSGQWVTPAMQRRLAGGLAIAVIVASIVGGGAAWRRWGELSPRQLSDNPRWLMLHVAVPMAAEAGFFGDGPGSFKLLYFNSPHLPRELYGRWKVVPYQTGEPPIIYSYAHDDYIQFAIEWGWIGMGLWAALVCGAIVRGIRSYRRSYVPGNRLILAAALVANGGVLAHATVDWPLQVGSIQLYAAVYLALLYST